MKLGSGVSAVIVGGTTGPGAATAEALATAGCKVAILDTHREQGEALAAKVGGLYRPIEDEGEASVDAALAAAREANGVERVLVNFVAEVEHHPTVWRDAEGGVLIHDIPCFERLLRVNLTRTFYLSAKAAQAMMDLPTLGTSGERGVIINLVSGSSEDGLGGEAAFAASEGGVLALTRPMARDLAAEGIRVMTIIPGGAEAAPRVIEICEDDAMNGQVLRLEETLRAAQ
jgi:NAD(P)-dependent dehydrogenase (short-subunit alcohol dehydrogenase family)